MTGTIDANRELLLEIHESAAVLAQGIRLGECTVHDEHTMLKRKAYERLLDRLDVLHARMFPRDEEHLRKFDFGIIDPTDPKIRFGLMR